MCLQELEDSFNYGLFQPPLNGRAGKFLDEERRLAEYPFQASLGHLEVGTGRVQRKTVMLTFCMTGRDVSREPGADRLYFIPEYKLELISHKLREKMICILFSSSSSKDESTKC